MNRRQSVHKKVYSKRLGFHFFSTDEKYNDANLSAVLRQLPAFQTGWIVLTASPSRAIPEYFIRSLVDHHINPLIHFNSSLSEVINPAEYDALLLAYANWGVSHVIFFDKPNQSSSWSTADWVQQNVVDRFLDRFIPLGNLAIAHGLTPVFPPLEPGGSLWDTIFLRMALEGLQRRKQLELLDHLDLAVYGWTFGHGLDWGAGGEERNPENKAYSQKSLDEHLGFRLIDWYNPICETILQRKLPFHILQAGSIGGQLDSASLSEKEVQDIQEITRLLNSEAGSVESNLKHTLEPLPDNVVSVNFQCFDPSNQSVFTVFPDLQQNFSEAMSPKFASKAGISDTSPADLHPFEDFVLLPSYEWGVADWHLDVIRPFIKKHRPIVGFSINEARYAKNIFAIGDLTQFPDEQLDELRLAGCRVERISGSGTSIATTLAER